MSVRESRDVGYHSTSQKLGTRHSEFCASLVHYSIDDPSLQLYSHSSVRAYPEREAGPIEYILVSKSSAILPLLQLIDKTFSLAVELEISTLVHEDACDTLRDVGRTRGVYCPGRTRSVGKVYTDCQTRGKDSEPGETVQVDKVSWYLVFCSRLTVDRTTTIGKMIDSYLRSAEDLDDRVIHLLFSANRWEARFLFSVNPH